MSQLIERIVDGGQRSGVGALSGPSFSREVAAGMPTAVTAAARDLARGVNVEMPITGQMYEVLYEDKSPRQAVVDLMTRGLRREAD